MGVSVRADIRKVRGNPDKPSLRENALAVRALSPAMAARAQAYLFIAAGVVGSLGVLLPHPDRYSSTGLLAIQCASFAAAAVLLVLGARTPDWVTTCGPFGAAVLTSMAIVLTGTSTSAYLLFYMWVAFYAFYFLSRRQAALLCLFAIVNYAAVVVGARMFGYTATGADANQDIPAFVLITGTICVAGVFLVRLRERIGRLIDQLTDAASTDPLTGLLNRRGFQSVIDHELARSERGGHSFSLLLADCDFFKQLNDRLGHHAGDEALQTIGRLLEVNKRRIDIAARVGGEEFALVLPETDQHEAFIVAERLRSRFGETFADQPVPLTLSLGVATFPAHGLSADALLRSADEALYAAKSLGRDRTVLYSAEVQGILSIGEEGRSDRERDHAHLATVLNLAEALDMRDTGTARHSQTVGRYCELMARELGLEAEQVERVRVAGVLHDIGKIGVPDAILRKPGPLTAEEFEQMKKHPEIGARILGGSGLNDIRGWILAHHERPDGRGYPAKLGDDEIPLEAKILAVADSYEAMTSDRVYRKSIGESAAREQLESCSGSQFDPRVVEAFLSILDRSGASAISPTRPVPSS
jgi:diguanylate cyclase (GGDEF)-like protein/putative nucleotidyltransferase with HDIG domain